MKQKKILIFGAGWLGMKLADYLDTEVVKTDIANASRVRTTLQAHRPDMVINAAGRAGPPKEEQGRPGIPNNIDWCVLSESNRQKTWYSNVDGPKVLGAECAVRGIHLTHLSSGCIFDGSSPGPRGWMETDTPCPVSYYAETKVKGEHELIATGADPLIVRLRLPVDSVPSGRNLITKLAGYGNNVIDVINSVTVVDSLLFAVRALIRQEKTGIFHVTNPEAVSHRQIMSWYQELVAPEHQYEIVPASEIENLAAEGRSNCILDTSKLRAAGVELDRAPHAIRSCMMRYAMLWQPR